MIYMNRKEKYTGQWVNNLQEGRGIYIWYEGKNDLKCLNNRYVGEWKGGKRTGYGIFYYSNGAKYEGTWNDNQKNGFGLLTFQDGTEYLGLFKMDVLVNVNDQITLEKIDAEYRELNKGKQPKIVLPKKLKETAQSKAKPISKKPTGNLESIAEKNENETTGDPNTIANTLANTNLNATINPKASLDLGSIKANKKYNLEKSLNNFEIFIDIKDLMQNSPALTSSMQEIGNLLLRNLSEIKRWYISSFRPEASDTEEAKERNNQAYLPPPCINSNDLAFGMELKDLWRFLREVGSISSSFSIADFNHIFYNQMKNYYELFYVPDEYEGTEIYDYLYQKISKEKQFFADRYSPFTTYYLNKDPTNASLNYLRKSETRGVLRSRTSVLLINVSREYELEKSIHYEKQIILLRQFYDALIRCAYMKNFYKDIPFHQKFKEFLLECSAAKPHLKRAKVNKSSMSKLESSFQAKEMQKHTEAEKARNMEYMMIDEFFHNYQKQLRPIFNKLYISFTDTTNGNDMSISYKFFYQKIIQKSTLFKEIGIDKIRFSEFIVFYHKEKKLLTNDEIRNDCNLTFIHMEELFDTHFIFFEFCELVFFLIRKYILRKKLKEDDSDEHSLEIINHIWSLVKITGDKTRGRRLYDYPYLYQHKEIERQLEEQKHFEEIQERKMKEIQRYTEERKEMDMDNGNAYVEEVFDDEESDESEYN